jgi:hypothetical protein
MQATRDARSRERPPGDGELNMTKLIPAAFAIAILSGTAMAQNASPKQDIRGFTPGMSRAEIESAAQKSNCIFEGKYRCHTQEPEPDRISILFQFTSHTSVVHMVDATFKSGSTPTELIAVISTQYSRQPDSVLRPNITESEMYRIAEAYAALLNGDLLQLAKWKLSDLVTLELGKSLRGDFPYKLQLYSKRLDEIDKEIDRQEEEQRRRSLNPAPKF